MSYNLDSLTHNQDWTKAGTWDLPSTAEEFKAWARRNGVDLGAFRRLPVYQAHVDDPGLDWLRAVCDASAEEADTDGNLAEHQTPGYSGGETLFGAETQAPDASILNFWQWAYSDLTDNVNRGVFAEWMVAKLLGVVFRTTRQLWDAYDLTTPEGIRVEVKASAFVHSWSKPSGALSEAKPSKIEFTNLCARLWTNDKQTHVADCVTYNADVYVFCCQTNPDSATWSALDLDQWEFYVLSRADLEAHGYRSIALGTLRRLTSVVLPGQLRMAVRRAAGFAMEDD